jgi:hypothetical protein
MSVVIIVIAFDFVVVGLKLQKWVGKLQQLSATTHNEMDSKGRHSRGRGAGRT